jgi:hypothetical protein
MLERRKTGSSSLLASVAERTIVQSGERCLSFAAAAALEPSERSVVTELSKDCNYFKGKVDARVRR